MDADLAWVWEAFMDLRAAAQPGMGPGKITHSEIVAYCDLHDIRERRLFTRLIRALDAELIAHGTKHKDQH